VLTAALKPSGTSAAINQLHERVERIGDAASTPSEIAAAANLALIDLQGNGVAEALIGQADSGEAPLRAALLRVLAERHQAEALPLMRKALNDNDAQVRRAALKSIEALGTQQDLAALVEMVLAKKDAAERDQAAQAMAELGRRLPDKSASCAPILDALAKADAATKICLLAVLPTLGGDQALQAARDALASEGDVRKTAVRALAEWPGTAPMADLLKVAKEDKEQSIQVLALRGYIHMAGQLGRTRSEQRLQAYQAALELAARPDEKRQVLNGLAELANAGSLKLVEPYLEPAELQREAFVAYERIAESLARRQPALAKEALQRVAEKAPDADLRGKAQSALEKIK
jgi:hypothetical protein